MALPAALWFVVGVVASGCGTEHDSPSDSAACTQGPTASLSSELDGTMSLSPDVVAPGDRFTAMYTERRPRTDTLFLETDGSGQCARVFMLYQGSSWEELSNGEDIDNLAEVDERRSVRGVVPSTAGPGVYRVCDDEGTACALLTVR